MEENLQTETSNTPPQTVQKMQTNSFAIPVAIVFGFALIAAAIFFSGHASTLTQNKAADGTNADTATDSAPKGPIRPIDEKDHIRGNPNAPIVILEYSDYDCPFCKAFHETMVKVMNAYGPGGKVAWVYRHFPLQQLHPNAPALAGV